MNFEHISYNEKTGKNSKWIEIYNYHKAASVLAEYGFDCLRLADDWHGADFLAYHKASGHTLQVQLKTCLILDRKYLETPDLYLCFTLDGTIGTWYLIKHSELMEVVKAVAPKWLETNRWRNAGGIFKYSGTPAILQALESHAYRAELGTLGFRECPRDYQQRNTPGMDR